MSPEQIRELVRKQLSNQLPGAFPRPPFEPYLLPIQGPAPGVPSAASTSKTYRYVGPEEPARG